MADKDYFFFIFLYAFFYEKLHEDIFNYLLFIIIKIANINSTKTLNKNQVETQICKRTATKTTTFF